MDVNPSIRTPQAWDNGIRYFDTSPHYGIGHSERRIGGLLRGKPREEVTLSTKVGRLLIPQDPPGRMDESFAAPATHRRGRRRAGGGGGVRTPVSHDEKSGGRGPIGGQVGACASN